MGVERLGRYEVLRHLASGGMADVLLARSTGIEGFERHVVLKRIRAELREDERFASMFLAEAKLAAGLHHQNIVQVFDIGEADGEYFFAMEYLHGEDLRKLLYMVAKHRAHVPLGNAVAIAMAAAAGLHHAHERRGPDKRPLGIVHRDVSPSNIIVGYDGSIKLVDFGIAKAESQAEEKTIAGARKGKVAYMSPEQCKNQPVDRRSDIWSLGVVLYEMATTTRLFKGESDYLTMEAIVEGRIPPPRGRRADIPEELAAIIARALEVKPADRYATADELRVALEAFAMKAGLAVTPASLAAYVKQYFGERLEPWLDTAPEAPEVGPAAWSEPSGSKSVGSIDPNGAVKAPASPETRTSGKFGFEQKLQTRYPMAPRARRGGAAIAAVALGVVALAGGGVAWQHYAGAPASAPGELADATIHAVGAGHLREALACEAGRSPHGELAIRFAVDAAGKVTRVDLMAGTSDPAYAACMVHDLASWQFLASDATTGEYRRIFP